MARRRGSRSSSEAKAIALLIVGVVALLAAIPRQVWLLLGLATAVVFAGIGLVALVTAMPVPLRALVALLAMVGVAYWLYAHVKTKRAAAAERMQRVRRKVTAGVQLGGQADAIGLAGLVQPRAKPARDEPSQTNSRTPQQAPVRMKSVAAAVAREAAPVATHRPAQGNESPIMPVSSVAEAPRTASQTSVSVKTRATDVAVSRNSMPDSAPQGLEFPTVESEPSEMRPLEYRAQQDTGGSDRTSWSAPEAPAHIARSSAPMESHEPLNF